MSRESRVGPEQFKRIPQRRALRRESTDAERLLWRSLKGRQLDGVKFRRQHPFGPFILDFVALEQRLVIEVDGGGHFHPEQQAYDAERTRFLEAHGLRVLRFDNVQVLRETEAVLTRVWEAVSALPSP